MIVSDNPWIFPVLPIKLSRNDVHVWRLDIEQSHLDLFEFTSILSEEERMRAASFHFERHRNQFILGRGVLRTLLSLYLNTKPDLVEFRYGAHGKPDLTKGCLKETFQFNLAHSHKLVIYAFTSNRKVGVDLEYIHNIPDVEKVAGEFLSKRENSIFRTLPRGEKLRAFFECWTKREAYGKAIGAGLTRQFEEFEAKLPKGGPNHTAKNHIVETSKWSMASFAPTPEYTAALVVEGYDWHLHCFQFLPEIAEKMCGESPYAQFKAKMV